ncbi:MAG: 3-phosphoshikimate 1-carboxyvinyltransferase, partial [Phycisphaerae bacterium]
MATRTITPAPGPVTGSVRPPGSKSLTNRALAVAALADGRTTIESAGFSDDTRVMAEALRALGIEVETDEPARRLR